MTRNDSHPMLAEWKDERDRFERLLITRPTCRYAWYWEIRLKILRYLVQRYEKTPTEFRRQSTSAGANRLLLNSVQPCCRLKKPTRIRELLDSIREENRTGRAFEGR